VGPSKIDAVWVYVLNYGGGIVSVSFIPFLVFHHSRCLDFFFFVAYDFGLVFAL